MGRPKHYSLDAEVLLLSGKSKECQENGTKKASKRLKTKSRYKHPTTSEPKYSRDEVEFMMAMQDYKRTSGHNFPTWSEALKVLLSLGYKKVTQGVNCCEDCRKKN